MSWFLLSPLSAPARIESRRTRLARPCRPSKRNVMLRPRSSIFFGSAWRAGAGEHAPPRNDMRKCNRSSFFQAPLALAIEIARRLPKNDSPPASSRQVTCWPLHSSLPALSYATTGQEKSSSCKHCVNPSMYRESMCDDGPTALPYAILAISLLLRSPGRNYVGGESRRTTSYRRYRVLHVGVSSAAVLISACLSHATNE
ncbi:hypothetical protein DENSPDRAFT_144071 [Dentipellis sp. KUC8613]|nr:hypothetical protein DENSPDRAFT_144071 [Dentipellis sp. KUC8613]